MKLPHRLLTIAAMASITSAVAENAQESQASAHHSAAIDLEADRAEKAAFDRVTAKIFSAEEAYQDHRVVDFSALRRAMDQYWADYPQGWRSPLMFYMEFFAKVHPQRVEAEWASFTECVNPAVAQTARAKVRFATLSREPFDFTFTALDGRSVDLRKLRGKVVLIDFWATWCAPCVDQMPELKRLYALYRDHGLEIIGVSLDRAADKQKLLDFIGDKGLTWPQHFDGKVWQNEIAARYAVSAAPTTFLLNQEGKLVGINLEAKLESEVKRLLGPPHATAR